MSTKHRTIKLGLLGAGRIGQVHAETLARRLPGADLVAVFDVERERARSLAEATGIDCICSSAEALLGTAELDGVLICTSTDTHASLIEAAAEAGKHIFCEKPIDLDIEKIDRALRAVDSASVTLQVGFNRRFDPNFLEVRRQVRDGAIGQPHMLRITSRDPEPPPTSYVKSSGSLFQDMMIHDFDMARFLVGADIVKVYAIGAARIDPEIASYGHIDTALVSLEFDDGTLGSIDCSRQAAYGYDQRVEVFGAEGVAWAENNSASRTGVGNSSGMHLPRPLSFFMDRYTESYVGEIEEFVACLRDGRAPSVQGGDGRRAGLLAAAAQQSFAEARPIEIPL